jgi:DNA-directed RNA polymerase subunit K/omega
MVVAKRARKISADQKLEIDKLVHPFEQEETMPVEGEAEMVIKQPEERPNIDFVKPTVLAFSELEKGELEYQYLEKGGN